MHNRFVSKSLTKMVQKTLERIRKRRIMADESTTEK